MGFPFTISTKIAIPKKDNPYLKPSSLFNEIDQFMEPFEMIHQQKNEREIYYQKGGHIPFRKLHNIIRALEYQLNDDESKVIITVKTDTTLVFFLGFLPQYIRTNNNYHNLIIPISMILLWVCGYSLKYFTLLRLKKDLQERLIKIKE